MTEKTMSEGRLEEIRAAAGYEFNPGTIALSAAWELIHEVDRLRSVAARQERMEESVVTLGRAAAFYADFEESGQSDWSIAMGACKQVYGRIPMVDEGGDPDCYRLPALSPPPVASEENA